MGLLDIIPISLPSFYVGLLFVSTLFLLAVLDVLIISFTSLPKAIKHIVLTAPSAFIMLLYYAFFPSLRTWIVGIPVAVGFANWLYHKVEKMEEKRRSHF